MHLKTLSTYFIVKFKNINHLHLELLYFSFQLTHIRTQNTEIIRSAKIPSPKMFSFFLKNFIRYYINQVKYFN